MTNHLKRLVFINVLGTVAVLTVNFLANSLPLNGRTTGELSNLYPNLFVPAGLTFSIWGVIYLWLITWVGFQVAALFRQSLSERVSPTLQRIGWIYLDTCVLNIVWLFAWHWEALWLSTLIMIWLLYRLLRINTLIGAEQAPFDRWVVRPAFGLYQGWITVALIANVTTALIASNWNGFGLAPAHWAICMILVGGGLALWMVWRRHNLFHGVAVAWAFLGIYLKRAEAGDAPEVGVVAAGAGVVVVAFVVVRGWFGK